MKNLYIIRPSLRFAWTISKRNFHNSS